MVNSSHAGRGPEQGRRVNGELRVEDDHPGHESRGPVTILYPAGLVGYAEPAREFTRGEGGCESDMGYALPLELGGQTLSPGTPHPEALEVTFGGHPLAEA